MKMTTVEIKKAESRVIIKALGFARDSTVKALYVSGLRQMSDCATYFADNYVEIDNQIGENNMGRKLDFTDIIFEFE